MRPALRVVRSLALIALLPAAFLAGQVLTRPPTAPAVTLRRVALWHRFGSHRLLAPTGVACAPDGGMAITDRDANRVYKVTAAGRLLATAGGLGQLPGRFRFPSGVGVDRSGNVYIADLFNNRIQVLDGRLRFLRAIVPGVPRPGGVLPDGRGGLWVSAGEFTGWKWSLLHLDARGRPEGTMGPPVQGFPARDDRGRVWIADRNTHDDPVLEFGRDGHVARQWGGSRMGMAEDLAVARGMVCVSDRGRAVLSVYNTQGRLLGRASRADLTAPDGAFEAPYGLAFDRQGYLWACFLNEGLVAKYQVVTGP